MLSRARILAVALAAAAPAPAAAESPKPQAARTADEVTPEAFSLFSLTMENARQNALQARDDAFALMRPEERALAQPRYADLAGPSRLAESAGGAAVEAAFTTSAAADPAAGPDARRRLAAVGVANERAAREARGEARYRDPVRSDEKGYYFSHAQTRRYYSNRYTDRIGLYSSAYYELLRCRSATPIGLLGENPAWRRSWSWRVCPDAQGRYRPTL